MMDGILLGGVWIIAGLLVQEVLPFTNDPATFALCVVLWPLYLPIALVIILVDRFEKGAKQ